jgi:hypothetical protein
VLLFGEECLVAASASKLFAKRSPFAHQQLNPAALRQIYKSSTLSMH